MTAAGRDPFVSVIMPAYETPGSLLRRSIASVLDQTWTDFELIVVDDGSTQPDVTRILDEISAHDPRLRPIRRATNGGIVAASQDGLAAARGQFVALVDHDDLLVPEALAICCAHLQGNPECDFMYTDEAWIDMDDHVLAPFLKPDWSPERLRGQMYVNHLSLYRRSLVEEVGGFRAGFDGSQDYDLVLRVTERARQVIHIKEILYHWRIRPGQVSGTGNPAVYGAARRAIEEHCARIGINGTVEQTNPLGLYRVHRVVSGEPLVSLVIPTRGSSGIVWGEKRTFLIEAVRSVLARSTYRNIEFVVVADRVMPDDVTEQLVEACGDRLRLLWYDLPFNYSHKVNLGVASAHGEFVALLNDDVEVISPDWIETMLSLAQQPDVGMVGCSLLFEDGTLQHAGHLYLSGSAIGHIAYGLDSNDPGPVYALQLERECSGVTAACAIVRRNDFLNLGGLSRTFPVNFNDVDFSLKLRTSGKRIVWTPFAQLYHFESKSREVGVGPAEIDRIRRRWGHVLDQGDSFWRDPDASWAVIEAIAVPDGAMRAVTMGY
jgi:glycosyltransferase involved in cell wall biosynthesis